MAFFGLIWISALERFESQEPGLYCAGARTQIWRETFTVNTVAVSKCLLKKDLHLCQ